MAEIALLLLRAGADVKALDGDRNNALHLAVHCGMHDLIVDLLINGCNIHAKNKVGIC